MKSEKKYARTPNSARPQMPYAVKTQAPRPSCRRKPEDDIEAVDSVGETTGARSSMQGTSGRKDRGANTLCVTPVRVVANRTCWPDFTSIFHPGRGKI